MSDRELADMMLFVIREARLPPFYVENIGVAPARRLDVKDDICPDCGDTALHWKASKSYWKDANGKWFYHGHKEGYIHHTRRPAIAQLFAWLRRATDELPVKKGGDDGEI